MKQGHLIKLTFQRQSNKWDFHQCVPTCTAAWLADAGTASRSRFCDRVTQEQYHLTTQKWAFNDSPVVKYS